MKTADISGQTLLLARDLGYLESEFQLECEQELDQIRRILNTLTERSKA